MKLDCLITIHRPDTDTEDYYVDGIDARSWYDGLMKIHEKATEMLANGGSAIKAIIILDRAEKGDGTINNRR